MQKKFRGMIPAGGKGPRRNRAGGTGGTFGRGPAGRRGVGEAGPGEVGAGGAVGMGPRREDGSVERQGPEGQVRVVFRRGSPPGGWAGGGTGPGEAGAGGALEREAAGRKERGEVEAGRRRCGRRRGDGAPPEGGGGGEEGTWRGRRGWCFGEREPAGGREAGEVGAERGGCGRRRGVEAPPGGWGGGGRGLEGGAWERERKGWAEKRSRPEAAPNHVLFTAASSAALPGFPGGGRRGPRPAR